MYSETTYVPEYGLLSDNYLRFFVLPSTQPKVYVGISTQSQTKTENDQTDLYKKNRLMPLIGLRGKIWKDLHGLAEARTEKRSRMGLYAGNIWQYSTLVFTEYYAEGMILPSFTNDPIFSGWVKQGLRFKPANSLYIDPYLELYARYSPDKDLGRDTQQARIGLRGIYLVNSWSFSLLTYQSFAKDESDHMEALFVVGGSF